MTSQPVSCFVMSFEEDNTTSRWLRNQQDICGKQDHPEITMVKVDSAYLIRPDKNLRFFNIMLNMSYEDKYIYIYIYGVTRLTF